MSQSLFINSIAVCLQIQLIMWLFTSNIQLINVIDQNMVNKKPNGNSNSIGWNMYIPITTKQHFLSILNILEFMVCSLAPAQCWNVLWTIITVHVFEIYIYIKSLSEYQVDICVGLFSLRKLAIFGVSAMKLHLLRYLG